MSNLVAFLELANVTNYKDSSNSSIPLGLEDQPLHLKPSILFMLLSVMGNFSVSTRLNSMQLKVYTLYEKKPNPNQNHTAS